VNTLMIAILCVGGGPFSAAIKQTAPTPPPLPPPVSNAEWVTTIVDSTAVDLPVITPPVYSRLAPQNYKMPMPSKMVAVPCPQHGYRCGMQRAVEDLLGHLQTVHAMTLEEANVMGRERWQDAHDDIHWALDTPERQALYLKPQPVAKPVVKSGCAGGNCPTQNYTPFRRFFR
jgi:hypothetical protein